MEGGTCFLFRRHGAIDACVRFQIKHFCFCRIAGQILNKIIRVGFGVRDDPVSERQGFLIQLFQEFRRKTAWAELFAILDKGVIKGYKEILDDRFLPEPAEKGQDQLRRKADKGQVVVLHAGFEQGRVNLQQAFRVAFIRGCNDSYLRGMFPEKGDLLGVAQVIQVLGGNKEHLFTGDRLDQVFVDHNVPSARCSRMRPSQLSAARSQEYFSSTGAGSAVSFSRSASRFTVPLSGSI